jgi:hypothetical protein
MVWALITGLSNFIILLLVDENVFESLCTGHFRYVCNFGSAQNQKGGVV